VSFAFAFVFGIFSRVRATAQRRVKRKGIVKPLPASSMLGASLKVLARVKEDARQEGWTSDLSRRAAAALRVAGAIALGRPVSQNVVGADVTEREGQLTVYSGWPKRRRVLLSAATTSRTIAAAMNNGHAPAAQTRANLETISEALGVLSTAGYGRQSKEDSSALDSALDDGTQAVRRIRSTTLWPRRTAQALRSFVGF
jgi:hypothetical protein